MPARRITPQEWEQRIVAAITERGPCTAIDLSKHSPGARGEYARQADALVRAGRLCVSPRRGNGGGVEYSLPIVAAAEVPSEEGDIPLDDLIGRRYQRYDAVQRAATDRSLLRINVTEQRPIAIWHCGDPHVDDDGTDLRLLHQHADIVRRTPGMFGGSVGDVTNNWVGKLARLYAQQDTTARDAWRLAEDLISRTDWLYLVSGNHDQWSGAGDPIPWIARLHGKPSNGTDARLALTWPDGSEITIWVRHSWPGSSQWNPAHGVAKAAQFDGLGWDLMVCGHTHVCAHQMVGHDDGSVTHALQVGSYKRHDRYARERGLRTGQAFAPAAVTILDPSAVCPSRVRVEWDVEAAADYLTHLRNKR